jgi:hypothetical protein
MNNSELFDFVNNAPSTSSQTQSQSQSQMNDKNIEITGTHL